MHIGIDVRSMLGTPTGVGRYLTNLLRQFRNISSQHIFTLYCDRATPAPLVPRPNFRQKTLTLPVAQNYFTWNHLRLPPELWRHPVDLFHFPFYTMPLVRNYASIVTIHDITYEIHPEWFSWKGRLAMRSFSKLAAKHAHHILTVSHATKRDIMRYYKIPEQNITVTYHGIEQEFRPVENADMFSTLRTRYHLNADNLVLYVGSIHTRRNVEQLIRAFRQVTLTQPETHLLIVGKREYPYLDIEGLLAELGIAEKVTLPGYVDDADLPGLYNLATVSIYPSSYEGFGFPVLESMACGTPVITADNSSLPEVGGDAAIYVDPLNIDEMADALTQLLTNNTLRRQCRERGLHRAAEFSWERTARQTLAAYERVRDKA